MNLSSFAGEFDVIQQAQAGDHEAFRSLVVIYEPPLLAYLWRMLGDRDDAYDIAQETFIAAYYALPRWQAPEQLRQEEHPLTPWLYRIATNRAFTLLKKQSNLRTLVPQHNEDERQDMMETPPEMPLEERLAVRDLLQEALRHLSEEDALCLVLRFVAGERYAEIATAIGISTEAARKRVTRSLNALRTIYMKLDSEVAR
ncbi:RNA polymerase sigma factor [Dictyobacter vulcani]|nr:RNA polymerase sigma factor [Dictyobacter vulcani]